VFDSRCGRISLNLLTFPPNVLPRCTSQQHTKQPSTSSSRLLLYLHRFLFHLDPPPKHTAAYCRPPLLPWNSVKARFVVPQANGAATTIYLNSSAATQPEQPFYREQTFKVDTTTLVTINQASGVHDTARSYSPSTIASSSFHLSASHLNTLQLPRSVLPPPTAAAQPGCSPPKIASSRPLQDAAQPNMVHSL
jgi:hypothetical protein